MRLSGSEGKIAQVFLLATFCIDSRLSQSDPAQQSTFLLLSDALLV